MQNEQSQFAQAVAEDGRYTWYFHVRHYELGPCGFVRPEVYLNWMQETGILASAKAGYSPERYAAMGKSWWVHRFRLEWRGDVQYPESLEATTWISSFRRIRALREYEIRRSNDQSLVCSAQADWAFVNTTTGQPTRVLEEMMAAFPPNGIEAVTTWPWTWNITPAQDKPFTSGRTVQYHELDTMGHVNHAVYLVWLLENLRTSVEGLGGEADLKLERFDLEYLHAARHGDGLLVSSWLLDWREPIGWWRHEIRLAGDETVIARACSQCRIGTRSNGCQG